MQSPLLLNQADRLRRRARGSALVIVLAFVVLLTSICLAVFIRARSESKISASSANQMKVSALADGAVNTILADLDAEIIAKSTATPVGSGATAGNLYIPKTPQDMVPERVGTSDTLPNLIKRSASGKLFFTGGADRAGNLPSDQPSQNGRFVSLARWNSHFLLPKKDLASDIDATPDASFIAPDWVLVTTDGSKVTVPDPKVVGRYAYAVYDEGGLLDLNVAGYPGQLVTDKKASQRGSLAFADLTQLTDDPSGAGGSQLLTQAQIDTIIGRRNFVSASIDTKTGDEAAVGGTFPTYTFTTQNAENYRRFGLFNPVNFLKTPRKNILAGDQKASDRLFLTRQEMISFLLNGVANGSAPDRAKLQNALQYFTQFTRDINQPSIIPPTGRPRTQANNGNNANGKTNYDTGNEVTGINPSFLKVRRKTATTAATSVDGTMAEIDDPVVSKRFPLNRIAWVTFKGPIADDNGTLSSDADIKPLIDAYKQEGFTEDFLKMGGPRNIKNAFGLEWQNDPNPLNAANKVWVYRKLDPATPQPKMRLLNEVAALNREPDFFELLRGAVTAGAITRAANDPAKTPYDEDPVTHLQNAADSNVNPLQYQSKRDESTVLATIQLGANIIDQFDPDGYPIQISIDDGTGARLAAGVENLPYIYRVRTGALMLTPANPPLPDANMFTYSYNAGTREQLVNGAQQNDLSIMENTGANKLISTGVATCLMIPEVWNPHNSQAPLSTLSPTKFRIVADSINPDNIGNSGLYYLFNMLAWKNGGQYWSDDAALATGGPAFPITSIGFTGTWRRRLSESNSVITFGVPNTTAGQAIFRDPTILFMANKPTGSELGVDASKMATGDLASFISSDSAGPGKGFINMGNVDTFIQPGLTQAKRIVGVPIGLIPLRWIGNRVSSTQRNLHSSMWATNQDARNTSYLMRNRYASVTFRLQYLRPGAAENSSIATDWLTYDTKYVDARVSTVAVPQGSKLWGPITGWVQFSAFSDPRTAKFGPMFVSPFYIASGGSQGAPAGSVLPPANNPGLEWLDAAEGTVISDLPSLTYKPVPGNNAVGNGITIVTRERYSVDFPSMVTPTTADRFGGNYRRYKPGMFSQNNGVSDYYRDSDGIVRPVALKKATATAGLPLAPYKGTGNFTAQENSRPVMINRPFRSVGELGYVFSGMPWRNIDFSHPQSAYSALLDLFCINETADPKSLVAGKVSLNTRQIPVIRAIIAGAYKNEVEINPDPTDATKVITPTLAAEIARVLVNRTTSNPIQNVSELVGKWVSGTGTAAVFDGFSKDIFGDVMKGTDPIVQGWSPSDAAISGFGESVIRSLADSGTTRVWNLMIDLVAQTGKYPPGSPNFVVEGEQRYWVHVAIDRFTGKIIDSNTEIVKE